MTAQEAKAIKEQAAAEVRRLTGLGLVHPNAANIGAGELQINALLAQAEKPAAPAKTEKTDKVVRTTLRDYPVGQVDGNQVLREKKGDGSLQLWQGKIGWGVVRVKKNRYVTELPVRSSEEAARKVFSSLN